MHRRKKLIVTATAVALLMAAGTSSAMAVRGGGNGPGDGDRMTICHATGSESNPYEEITVDENAVDEDGRGHAGHEDDIIPAPEEGCPDGTDPGPGDGDRMTICHATGSESNPYEEITVDENAVDEDGRGHAGHEDDIIPAPEEGCPDGPGPGPGPGPGEDEDDCVASSGSTQSQSGLINVGNINLGLNNVLGNLFCQSNVGNGLAAALIGDALGGDLDDDDDSDGDCIASSDSEQEQEGLVNVGNINLGLNNLLGNAFCQSNVLNGLAVAGIGDALAGDLDDDDSDGDCIASSDSEQEQEGAVNVGNVNVGPSLGNAFCQADVLNGVAVSVIGTAVGGSPLGGGLLGGLGGTSLLAGLTADVEVLASLLLQF